MALLKVQRILFAHICVVDCNVSRLETPTQAGKQSIMAFLKDLFNLFINDLTYFVNDAKLRLYADDTTQYLSHLNVLELTNQSNFDVLQSWFKCNYLSVNE